MARSRPLAVLLSSPGPGSSGSELKPGEVSLYDHWARGRETGRRWMFHGKSTGIGVNVTRKSPNSMDVSGKMINKTGGIFHSHVRLPEVNPISHSFYIKYHLENLAQASNLFILGIHEGAPFRHFLGFAVEWSPSWWADPLPGGLVWRVASWMHPGGMNKVYSIGVHTCKSIYFILSCLVLSCLVLI